MKQVGAWSKTVCLFQRGYENSGGTSGLLRNGKKEKKLNVKAQKQPYRLICVRERHD